MREALARRGTFTAILTLVSLAQGCGGAQQSHRGAEGPWYVVQFKAAALPATRASGQPWHTGGGEDNTLLGGLVGLALGYPGVGLMFGKAMSTGPSAEAPAAFVELKIAGDTYTVSPVGQSLAPRWEQPIAFPRARYPKSTPALIQIRDAVDESVLGQRELTVGELVSDGARTLTDLGDVRSLDLDVSTLPARGISTIALRVPTDRSLRALVQGVDVAWVPVPVWNGDRVTIQASGSVCPASDPSECYGPEGARPGAYSSYNYREFPKARHASLVAVLPGQTEVVGQTAGFVVQQSGFMLLFVNDTDEDNNEGVFDVEVTIEPAR